jgi:predicted phosphoribosyltransferase
VPVAPPSTQAELREEAEEVISVLQPEPFDGVGRWYSDFSQTTDEEVCRLLDLTGGGAPEGDSYDASQG